MEEDPHVDQNPKSPKTHQVFERLRVALFCSVTIGTNIRVLTSQRYTHIKCVTDKRWYYRLKMEMDKAGSAGYFSLTIYGADHKNYTLPHFTTKSKR